MVCKQLLTQAQDYLLREKSRSYQIPNMTTISSHFSLSNPHLHSIPAGMILANRATCTMHFSVTEGYLTRYQISVGISLGIKSSLNMTV